MVKSITIEKPRFIDTGAVDWAPVTKAFVDIENVLNEHRDETRALARRVSFSVNGMFETEGKHTLLGAGKHVRCKLVSAHAVLHDNIHRDARAKLTGLTGDVKFSDTEGKGSGKIFTVLPNANRHFSEPIEVEITGSRRISVYATFESTEEGQ